MTSSPSQPAAIPPASASPISSERPVVIIGAGLSGLCCARTLQRAGVPIVVLEASDAVGGRIRTDVVDGFLLDRGFAVYLTAYPEGKAQFDYAALDLRPFEPGAGVYFGSRFHTLMDPWRRPGSLLDGAVARVGSVTDKLKVGAMRSRVQRGKPEDRYERPEVSIADYLKAEGFSQSMIDRFFRPFFGGIFFDPTLATSSRAMEFVFRCFSQGDTVVPAGGMQRMPEQLAASLPTGTVRLNHRVTAIDSTPGSAAVHFTSEGTGQSGTIRAGAIVNAAPDCLFLPRAQGVPGQKDRTWRAVTCIYFAGKGQPPDAPGLGGGKTPLLLLDGEGRGPAANVVVMSNLSDRYAPPGHYLIACAILGSQPPECVTAAREQLARWFGTEVAAGLRHLRTYTIDHALPDQSAPCYTRSDWPVRISPGLYACGDTHDTASIDGALKSGRLAAEAVLADARPH